MSDNGKYDLGIRTVYPGGIVRANDHNRMGREVSNRTLRGSPDFMVSRVGNGTTIRSHNNEYGHPFRVFQFESNLFVNNGSVFHGGAGTMIADRRILPPSPKDPDVECDDGTNTSISRGGEYTIEIKPAMNMDGDLLVTEADWATGKRASSGDANLFVFCFPIGDLSETRYVWMDMSESTPKIRYSTKEGEGNPKTNAFDASQGVCIASILKGSGIIVQSVFGDIYDPIKRDTAKHPFKVELKSDGTGVTVNEGRVYGYNINNWWNSGNKEAEAIGEPGAVLWDSLKTYYLASNTTTSSGSSGSSGSNSGQLGSSNLPNGGSGSAYTGAPAGNNASITGSGSSSSSSGSSSSSSGSSSASAFVLNQNNQYCKWYDDPDSIDKDFPGTTSNDFSVYLYLHRDIRLGSQIYGAEFKPQGTNIKPQDPTDIEIQCTWQVRLGFGKTRDLLSKKYDTEKPSDYKTNAAVGVGSYRMDGWKCDRFGAVGCDNGFGNDFSSTDVATQDPDSVLGPDLTSTPADEDTNCCSSNIISYDNVTLKQGEYEYHLQLKKEYLSRIYSFWHGGSQYYEIARIVANLKKDENGNVVQEDDPTTGKKKDVITSRTVRQFLKSDFFFYPPADAYFSAVLTKVTLTGGNHTSDFTEPGGGTSTSV